MRIRNHEISFDPSLPSGREWTLPVIAAAGFVGGVDEKLSGDSSDLLSTSTLLVSVGMLAASAVKHLTSIERVPESPVDFPASQ